MPRVQSGSVELHVEVQGQGTPLLLVHGFPLDHSMWQAQIAELADRFLVIAPDLRGFGKSDVTEGTVSMAQYADDLAAMLDGLRITEPVVFCGLSMGGYIAWQFWLRHGKRVARLILCDTRAVADTEEVARGRRVSAEQVLADSSATLIDTMIPKLFAEQTRRDQRALVEQTRQVIRSAPPEGVAAALRGMAERPDVSGELPGISVPCLCICGEEDAISKPDEMRGIAERIPGGSFELIRGAGHMAPLEQPAAVNAAIRRWC